MQVSKRHTTLSLASHADSRFTESTLDKLEKSLQHKPDALHYFDLVFLDDGPVNSYHRRCLVQVSRIGSAVRNKVLPSS